MILGLWMPRDMSTAVHDYPFFMGDASTFGLKMWAARGRTSTRLVPTASPSVLNIAANPPKFSTRQRWLLSQNMRGADGVRHLTNLGRKCFHTAATATPEGMETPSVETRAMLSGDVALAPPSLASSDCG